MRFFAPPHFFARELPRDLERDFERDLDRDLDRDLERVFPQDLPRDLLRLIYERMKFLIKQRNVILSPIYMSDRRRCLLFLHFSGPSVCVSVRLSVSIFVGRDQISVLAL